MYFLTEVMTVQKSNSLFSESSPIGNWDLTCIYEKDPKTGSVFYYPGS